MDTAVAQTVSRAIDILEFCSARPRSLREVAEHLGVHRTTVSRMVQTLSDAGFLRKDGERGYGPGFRLAGLAQAALENFDLRSVVHPHIVRLSTRLGFTVQFAVPQAPNMLYVDKVEPPNAITLRTTIGGFVVVHTAGVSKAILANLPAPERNEILATATFERFTENTIASREDFDRVLAEVRERGWSADRGEYELFSNCIAAPVWDHSGQVAGAISITAFREIADVDALLERLPDLLATTAAISKELGWRPTPELGASVAGSSA